MKKIIIACVCVLVAAALAVVSIVVFRNPKSTDPSDDKPVRDDSDVTYTDDPIQDDRFELYKTYYYDNYQKSDAVCLLDLTHDGETDMLVLCVPESGPDWGQQDNFLRVYTVKDGAVELIYEQTIAYNRVGWYLTEITGESNFVFVNHAVWQGEGTFLCKEFYLTEEGEPVDIQEISRDVHFEDPDNDSIYESFEADIAEHYGESYENLTLLVSTITDERVQPGLSAEDVFGPAQEAGGSDDQDDQDAGDDQPEEPDIPVGNLPEFREQDLDVLSRIVSPLCEYKVSYDCEEDMFLDVFCSESQFGWSSGMDAYGLLKDGSTYKNVDYPEWGTASDPLGLLDGYGYYAIREDVLNEYKEKVYCNYFPLEKEPHENEIGQCQYYYLDGWYYFRKEIGGSETSIEFTSWEQTDRGTYLVHVDTIECGTDRTENAVQLEVTTLEKGEKLYWNIYRIIPA